VALVRAAVTLDKLKVNDEEMVGVRIVKRAMEDPARRIAANAGAEGSVVVGRIKDGKDAFGFNAASEKFEDMIKAGIIDPTKVVRTALLDAASVASILITTEAMIAEKPKDKPAAPAMPGGGGMGGMDF
jgi:chaperonin GroEL